MKKNIFLTAALATATVLGTLTIASAQQQDAGSVKVGGTATSIKNTDAQVDLQGTTKGFLNARVALKATTDFAPLSAHVAGMTVYNTATAGTAPIDVTPGYYYNDGTKWVRLGDAAQGKEPWQIKNTTDPATANTQNIYQKGDVAIGTQNGTGIFNIDATKNNAATGTPTATELLDDIIVTPKGNIGFGYKPSDATYPSPSGGTLMLGKDEKVTYSANGDLDFNYNLATTDKNEAIVHRGIISNGVIGAREARGRGQSIMAFEGYTSTADANLSYNALTQQRAAIVLRTGNSADLGGEIWFGTAGYNNYQLPNPQTTAKVEYRTIMDDKGNWRFGSSEGDSFTNVATQRIDVQLGGVRIFALGRGTLPAYRAVQAAERPNYISTDPSDRIVVADANGVLKTIAQTPVAINNPSNIRRGAGQIVADDYTVLLTGDATLPTPVGVKGKIYTLVYDDSAVTNMTVTGTMRYNGNNNTSVILSSGISNAQVTFQSDGVKWIIIGR
ncbi:hypothetical protein EZJ43_02760 [Pedobacter changchengzhani]|uniref:T9SS C-terminal target domain-containing protein n=1 Tax=Pedobacter changchengzhani TaxID=2529274 RepID=A0A4R5MRB5_9SPHI|nr:hypothetical protein [Pedobacter changchengzhani]TDG38029.1 hypothetical protein EZJ43_02760 [Pedobacter changchengzhani]